MAGKKPAAKKIASSKVGQIISIENGSEIRFKSVAKREAAVKANLGKSQRLSDFLKVAGWI